MIPNRAERIRASLEQQLLNGDLRPGDKLPSERHLAQTHDTSRPLVREALQSLKSQGLIESRRGGGTYVCEQYGEPQDSPLSDLLTAIPDRADLHAQLLEYRWTIEGQCAALAAERADAADLQRLERAYQHLRQTHQGHDLDAEGQADARFHLAIAAASHNRVFQQTLQGLFQLLKRNVITNIGGLARRPETRALLMRQHTNLFEAVYRRDPVAARRAAEEHLKYVEICTRDLQSERTRS